MILRHLHGRIETGLAQFPVVVLSGARGSGKTTLAKTFGKDYFDVENPQDLQRLEMEWTALMRRREPIVLDEVQAEPQLFLRLRAVIDESGKRTGRFLLVTSFATPLIKPLAGRAYTCELTPFLTGEYDETNEDDLWKRGGYPEVHLPDAAPFPDWPLAYLERMAQRDLPAWNFPARPLVTQRLFRMLAALHGQVWNASQMGKSLGISYHTVNTYVDFLERAFLMRRLPAYTDPGVKKRLARSPKYYWRDTGLLHALLRFDPEDSLYAQPWAGVSWEGWIIEQLLARLDAAGQPYRAYHFRTSDGHSLDLALHTRNRLWAFDVSITSLPGEEALQRLQKTAGMIGAHHAILISRTEAPVPYGTAESLNLKETIARVTNG